MIVDNLAWSINFNPFSMKQSWILKWRRPSYIVLEIISNFNDIHGVTRNSILTGEQQDSNRSVSIIIVIGVLPGSDSINRFVEKLR